MKTLFNYFFLGNVKKFPKRFSAVIFCAFSFLLFSGAPVFFSGCHRDEHRTSSTEKILYQCPMHPQVIQDRPGNCPICGMRLTRVEKAASAEKSVLPEHAAVNISPVQQQLIGMKTAVVEEKDLAVKIRTLGHVGYDPDRFESIAEYQEAAAAYRSYRGSPYTQIKEKANAVHELAMLKLRLAGFSDRQIEGLMNTGQLVAHYSLEPDVHWLYADVYEYESKLIHVGDKVQVKAPSLPGKVFTGTVRSLDTVLNASNRILRARIELDASGGQTLLPGATADVEINASLGRKLAVPQDAVVDTGDQQIVFVQKSGGVFEPLSLRLGHEASAVSEEGTSYYEVISGLQKGDILAASAVFFVDSESRLRAASGPSVAPAETNDSAPSKAESPAAAPQTNVHHHT